LWREAEVEADEQGEGGERRDEKGERP
jgi:hypothetical protein